MSAQTLNPYQNPRSGQNGTLHSCDVMTAAGAAQLGGADLTVDGEIVGFSGLLGVDAVVTIQSGGADGPTILTIMGKADTLLMAQFDAAHWRPFVGGFYVTISGTVTRFAPDIFVPSRVG